MQKIYSRAHKLLCKLYGLILGRNLNNSTEIAKEAISDRDWDNSLSFVEQDELEPRLMMSVYTVSSLGDRPEVEYNDFGEPLFAHNLTLREAIELANENYGHDEIVFSPAVAGGTINLKYGPLFITEGVTLSRRNSAMVTVASTPASMTLYTSPRRGLDAYSFNVDINSMKFVGRKVVNTYSYDGYTYSYTYGGGGLSITEANLHMYDSVIANNSHYYGAFRADDSNVTLNNCIFTGNSYYHSAMLMNSYFNISNCKFNNNENGIYFCESSGILNNSTIANSSSGAGVRISGGEVALDNAKIFNNTNINYSYRDYYTGKLTNFYGYGGGIYSMDADVAINNCQITNNKAKYGSGIYSFGSTVSINNSRIANNVNAMEYFTENTQGAGIYAYYSDILMQNSSVDGNRIHANANRLYYPWISMCGAGMYLKKTSCGIYYSNISNNSITGSGIYSYSAGAGIYSVKSDLTLSGSTISGNKINSAKSYASGGGIYSTRGTLNIENSKINSNSISAFNATGGGIYSEDDSAEISYSQIANNSISSGTSHYDGYTYKGAARGAGIYIGDMIITGSQITGNKAISKSVARGGGIYACWRNLQVYNTEISNNSVTGSGYYASLGSAIVGGYFANCIMTGNRSKILDDNSYYGPYAVYAFSGASVAGADLYSCNIINNITVGGDTAGVSGRVFNSIIWNNHCPGRPEYANLVLGEVHNSLIDVRGGLLDAIELLSDEPDELLQDYFQYYNILADKGFDPEFVDAANGNYDLKYNSPLRDAGPEGFEDFEGAPIYYKIDYTGDTRVVNTIDIGAYEYQFGQVESDGYCDTSHTLEVSAGNALVFHNFDNKKVRISVSGPGLCEVTLPGDDYCNPTIISLTGTTERTVFKISGPKGTTVGNILSEDALKAIIGGNVELTGDLNVGGTLKMLVLGDVDSVQQQEILLNTAGGEVSEKHKLVMDFKQLSDVTVNTGGMGVENMKMTGWLDLDGEVADELVAPWAGNIKSRGKANDGVIDFQADIILSGIGAPKDIALRNFNAQDVSGAWIKVDTGQFSGIRNISVAMWDEGGIIAPGLDKLTVRGDLNEMDLQLTGSEFADSDMTTVSIKGDFKDSSWSLAGGLKPLNAKGLIRRSSIFAEGDFLLKAYRIDDSLYSPHARVFEKNPAPYVPQQSDADSDDGVVITLYNYGF